MINIANYIERITAKPVFIVLKKLLILGIGAFISAISYNELVIPYNLLSGGINGIALITQYLFGFPVYIVMFLLNVPVFIWGLKSLKKEFLIYSFIGNVFLNIAILLTKGLFPIPHVDIFLASIFSGVVGAIGGGIVLKSGMSLGGLDIVGMVLKKKKNISIGSVSFYFNVFVIALSLMFFDLKIALYTIISMWVGSKVTDSVLDGLNRDKSVIIISEYHEEIAKRILEEMGRGVTYLRGEGGFSHGEKRIINCIVNHYEIAQLKGIVNKIDTFAFMYITEVIEVAGKGFTLNRRL